MKLIRFVPIGVDAVAFEDAVDGGEMYAHIVGYSSKLVAGLVTAAYFSLVLLRDRLPKKAGYTVTLKYVEDPRRALPKGFRQCLWLVPRGVPTTQFRFFLRSKRVSGHAGAPLYPIPLKDSEHTVGADAERFGERFAGLSRLITVAHTRFLRLVQAPLEMVWQIFCRLALDVYLLGVGTPDGIGFRGYSVLPPAAGRGAPPPWSSTPTSRFLWAKPCCNGIFFAFGALATGDTVPLEPDDSVALAVSARVVVPFQSSAVGRKDKPRRAPVRVHATDRVRGGLVRVFVGHHRGLGSSDRHGGY